PRHLAFEELLPVLVVHACNAPVQLSKRDELPLGEVRVRHVAAVELVHPSGELRATARSEAQAVARAPWIRSQPQPPAGSDVPVDETGVTLETAGCEDRRFSRGLAEAHVPGSPDEHVRETARIEPLADRARVSGLVRDHRRAERLEPRD